MSRTRRGSQAVEFALLLPILVTLFAGMVDFAQYLFLADGVVAAVGEGARAGAAASASEDPSALATQVAQTSWANAGLPGTLELNVQFQGSAPDQWIVVGGSVAYAAWFGFIGMPGTVSYTSIVRLVEQPD